MKINEKSKTIQSKKELINVFHCDHLRSWDHSV